MKRIYTVINSVFSFGCNFNFQSFIAKGTGRVLLAFFIAGMLLGATAPVSAQTANAKETAANVPAAAGTYQLIFNSKTQEVDVKLSAYELALIEKLRKENEIVYARASYSDDLRVLILPRSVITRASFKPAPLKFYKDEHNYEEWGHITYVEFE